MITVIPCFFILLKITIFAIGVIHSLLLCQLPGPDKVSRSQIVVSPALAEVPFAPTATLKRRPCGGGTSSGLSSVTRADYTLSSTASTGRST